MLVKLLDVAMTPLLSDTLDDEDEIMTGMCVMLFMTFPSEQYSESTPLPSSDDREEDSKVHQEGMRSIFLAKDPSH